MARGFLKGVVLGGAVSVGVASIGSILLPPPSPPQVSDAAPGGGNAPARPDDTQTARDTSRADPAPDVGQGAPQGQAPDPDTLAVLEPSTTAPAAPRVTGDLAGLDLPDAPSETGRVTTLGDDPVLPSPQALAPMAPQDPDTLSISTEPAQPPAPQDQEQATAFETADAAPASEDWSPARSTAPVVGAQAAQVAPAPAQQDDTTAQVTQGSTVPEAGTIATNTTTPPASPPAAAAPAEPGTPTVTMPVTTAPAQTASARPRIGTPAVTLTDRGDGVTINRPGNNDAADTPLREQAEGADADGGTRENMLPPVQAFAQPYEGADDKPMMGIVLIDDGTELTSGAQGIAALRSFPYPLSFAVDASRPDAAERMATFRAAGFEVLAMVDLPQGAQPSDAETAFNVILPRLNEVVAVLEGPSGGLQGGRDLSDQVTAILADAGLGLVTQDKGLNTMPKLARKEGVPADPVFRDFDSKGQSAAVIRRFLDQAAFKAGQEGAVIMLGRLRPDTISALLLWGLQDRASSVALAPISAVLTRP